MRLLLDENVHLSLVSILADHGHDVKHVVVDFDTSTPDPDILEIARLDNRVLITNDRDFGGLVRHEDFAHSGIIYLRLHHLRLMAQLPFILDALEFQQANPGRFTVVTPSGLR